MTETNSAKLSEEILLKVNTKLQKESTIFHKVNHGEKFTKDDVRAYALSQVQTKQDELELYRVLRENYVTRDFMPDVQKIKTFDDLIESAQLNIDFYTLMAREFE